MPATGPGVASVRASVASIDPSPGPRSAAGPGQAAGDRGRRAWRRRPSRPGSPSAARRSRPRRTAMCPTSPRATRPAGGPGRPAADPAGTPDQAVERQGHALPTKASEQHARRELASGPAARSGPGRTTRPAAPGRAATRPGRRSGSAGPARPAAAGRRAPLARPASQAVLEVSLLGVGADLEQVGDGHVAGGQHGDRQRRRGDRPERAAQGDAQQDAPGP